MTVAASSPLPPPSFLPLSAIDCARQQSSVPSLIDFRVLNSPPSFTLASSESAGVQFFPSPPLHWQRVGSLVFPLFRLALALLEDLGGGLFFLSFFFKQDADIVFPFPPNTTTGSMTMSSFFSALPHEDR